MNNNVSFHFAGGDFGDTRNVETLARKLLENAAVQYARQTSVSRSGVSLLAYTYIYV